MHVTDPTATLHEYMILLTIKMSQGGSKPLLANLYEETLEDAPPECMVRPHECRYMPLLAPTTALVVHGVGRLLYSTVIIVHAAAVLYEACPSTRAP